MDTNDFLGSFAQENVSFQTQVIRNASVGQNYWTVMIFLEASRYITSSQAGWEAVGSSSTIKAVSVTADTYTQYVPDNLLRSWLNDLFINGFTGNCILVSTGVDIGEDDADFTNFNEAMETAYELLKAYAYHKTVLAGPSSDALAPSIAVKLASLCAQDSAYLSGAPYYPFTSTTPESPNTDPIYTALTTAGVDAVMTYHSDTTRNGSLYRLGLAFAASINNGSGTCVGNSMDMVKSNNITASAGGLSPTTAVKTALKGVNVSYFKPVGDNTGYVAAEGASTLKGTVIQAQWIIAYVTYMTKVRVAQQITTVNYLRNASHYSSILLTMQSILNLFGQNGSGRLESLAITAPAFEDIPKSTDTIIIQNAWSATYTDQSRSVQITGALYIG